MKRREFLAAAGTLSTLSLTGGDESCAATRDFDSKRQFIEIRTYWAPDDFKQAVLIEKMDEKIIPFRNKMGFQPIGVFTVDRALHKDDQNYDSRFDRAVFVISASNDLSAFVQFSPKELVNIPAEDFINQNPDDLYYVDQTRELLYAIDGFPTIAVPNKSSDRVIQLRRYNSMNENRNWAKIGMFQNRGELSLFQSCGMAPVFFGETLFGDMAPSLTYMLSFENEAARKAGWKKFVESSEWKQMSGEEEFKFTATRIRNLCLRPTPGSQI